jgi:hypothetical protein
MYFKIIMALTLLLPAFASATSSDSRTSAWLMSLTRMKLTEDLRAFVDVQPRFTLNDTSGGEDKALSTLLMRGALGYQLTPNVGLYQGYAYIPTYDPKRVEHRSFQELLIKQALSTGALAYRLRFEQRFLDGLDDTAYRFRYFMRYTRPLTNINPKLSLAMNEEVFINLNDADDGPQSGFNQNRLFLGLNYKVNSQLSYDIGYQNQIVNVLGGRNNVMNHILFFGIITNFSIIGR